MNNGTDTLLLQLFTIFVWAKVFGEVFERLTLPAVLRSTFRPRLMAPPRIWPPTRKESHNPRKKPWRAGSGYASAMLLSASQKRPALRPQSAAPRSSSHELWLHVCALRLPVRCSSISYNLPFFQHEQSQYFVRFLSVITLCACFS